jgi:type II secretion system protein N
MKERVLEWLRDPVVQKRLFRWAGIPLFYLFCLGLFVRLTFPYQVIKERLVSEFNATSKERLLEIGEMGGYGLFGISAESVRLIPRVPGPGAVAALAVDELDLSASLLSGLFGAIDVSYAISVGGGEIEGTFYQDDSLAEIAVDGEGVDVSSVGIFSEMIGLPVGGTLGGHVEMRLPERKVAQAEGNFELQISDLTVGDGKAKVRETIALPKINAGQLSLKAVVVAGRMDISELSAVGKDLELQAGGKIRLREPFDKSAVDLEAGFQFKEAYTSQSELTRGIFGSKDSRVPGLFDMDPNVRKAKDDKGFYNWRVSGMLAHPSFRPGGPSKGLKDKKDKE